MRALPSLHTNMLLNEPVFRAELNRANGNRDRQIYPVVGPGPEPGTSALNLKVKEPITPSMASWISTMKAPPARPIFG